MGCGVSTAAPGSGDGKPLKMKGNGLKKGIMLAGKGEKVSEKGKYSMPALFAQFDADGDGKLDIYEIARAFRAIGLEKRQGGDSDMDKATFKSFDTDKDGYVDMKEIGANMPDKLRAKIEGKIDMGWAFDKEKWEASVKRHKKYDMGEIFKQFDADGDGKLDIYEIARAFRALGLTKREGEKSDMDKAMFKSLDENGDGLVNMDEIRRNLNPKVRRKIELSLDAGWTFDKEKWEASVKRHKKYDMKKIFAQFDADGDGKLDIYEFARAFRAIGLPKRDGTKMEMDKAMFKSFDTNGDGYVSMEELDENLKPKTRRKIELALEGGWKFDKAMWDASVARHKKSVVPAILWSSSRESASLTPKPENEPRSNLVVDSSTNCSVSNHSATTPTAVTAAALLPLQSHWPEHIKQMHRRLQQGEAQLFDVREQDEADMGMQATALVPLSQLKAGIAPPHDRSKVTYVHCAKGKRAQVAKPMLEDMGFLEVVPLAEGYAALISIGFFVTDRVARGLEMAAYAIRKRSDPRWAKMLRLEFPMYALPMKEFLSLEHLQPHNWLKKHGLLVQLDLNGEHADCNINFVSHQWLGYAEADPDKAHLHTMQDVFRRVIAGENLFSTEEEWGAYAKGYKSINLAHFGSASFASNKARVIEEAAVSRDDFQRSVLDSYVWMDYISIPQVIGLVDEREVREALHHQGCAIRSIPSYVVHVSNFWICAPSGAPHKDVPGAMMDYRSWHGRGWCRLEEMVRVLTKLGDGRPLLIRQPLHAPPSLTVTDSLDRLVVHTQRRSAVLTGEYSCCRMGHCVTSADGTVNKIPCDKDIVRGVLEEVLEQTYELLREGFIADPEHVGDVWGCEFGRQSTDRSFSTYLRLSVLKPAILAQSVEPPDFVHEGWSKAFEELTSEDAEQYFQHYGLHWPQPASSMLLPAWEGNLPMLRYFIEKAGHSPACTNPPGLTPLICAARGGHPAICEYLCSLGPSHGVDTAHINQSTPGAGLCALIDAAMRGHADVIEVLLRHNADVNIRRKNGKTALHVAVEEAHIECVLLLCASGSDLTATDSAGRTPAMLSSVSEISEFLNAKGANDRELVDAYRNRYRRATNEALGSPAFIGHQADAPDWRNEP